MISIGNNWVTAQLLLSGDTIPAYSVWELEIDLASLRCQGSGEPFHVSTLTAGLEPVEGIGVKAEAKGYFPEEKPRHNIIQRIFLVLENRTASTITFTNKKLVFGGFGGAVGFPTPRASLPAIEATEGSPFTLKDSDEVTIAVRCSVLPSITPDAGIFALADGTRDFTGDQSMGGNKLTHVADATDGEDAPNWAQVQELVASITDFQGTWDAAANEPHLASGVGVLGQVWLVSAAGSTNLDGTTGWLPGDFAVFTGTVWKRVPSALTGALLAANNLSELTNKTLAQSNLGLGSMALRNTTELAIDLEGRTGSVPLTASDLKNSALTFVNAPAGNIALIIPDGTTGVWALRNDTVGGKNIVVSNSNSPKSPGKIIKRPGADELFFLLSLSPILGRLPWMRPVNGWLFPIT